MLLRPPLRIATAIALTTSAFAAEGDGGGDAAEAEPQGWSHEAQIGGFFTSVATQNTDQSRDAAIAGSAESMSYLLNLEGALTWRRDQHSVEQTLLMKFGRQRQEGQEWLENTDEIDYDGAYKYHLNAPHFMYGAWGADTVFTGTDPARKFADPFTAKVSAGYGQERHWEKRDQRWEWRAGARAQRTWGRGLSDDDREVKTGLEFVTRYSSTPLEDLSWWIQYEAFSEFEDPGHISNLLTADFSYKLMAYLTLKLTLRAYYETEPDDAISGIGYDEFSWRQDTLLGLTYDL